MTSGFGVSGNVTLHSWSGFSTSPQVSPRAKLHISTGPKEVVLSEKVILENKKSRSKINVYTRDREDKNQNRIIFLVKIFRKFCERSKESNEK